MLSVLSIIKNNNKQSKRHKEILGGENKRQQKNWIRMNVEM